MLSTLQTFETPTLRQKYQLRTSFKFKCGPSEIEPTPSYKYLGVWLVNTSTTKTVFMHLVNLPEKFCS